MVRKRQQDGFTLLELLVSITALGIIVVGFLTLFNTSFINTYKLGHNTDAMATAAMRMELLIASSPLPETEIITRLEDMDGERIAAINVLDATKEFNFHIESGSMTVSDVMVTGHRVTIIEFYNDGERHVTLTSFIRGG